MVGTCRNLAHYRPERFWRTCFGGWRQPAQNRIDPRNSQQKELSKPKMQRQIIVLNDPEN